MKVVLVTPNYHQQRGNTITVQRISSKLAAYGVETEIVSISENVEENPTFLPKGDIIHGFNAYQFFKFKENLTTNLHNYVVTLTGTDFNYDLFNDQKRAKGIQSLIEAKAVHVFNQHAKKVILKEVPQIQNKIFVIEQDINDFDDNRSSPIQKEENTFLFVLPAGIRPVKNVPFAIEALKIVHNKYPYIRLLLVGPELDKLEGKLVRDLVHKNKWVRYIGEVPHQDMGSVYKIADSLLNTSYTEGQSTAIMEGMAYGLPVLVSHNDGNLSLVEHEKTGFVYKNLSEFIVYAEAIIDRTKKRNELGSAAKKFINNHHSNSKEVNHLLKIYQQVLEPTNNYDN
ncbi:glycosyltransferase family 4 protein [Mesobacillus maritimus]|uniref:glycosyltransferase n=1 Tax=Mesobacillus maritimus TaxID=1643336 RepID=UPI00203B12BD|nr:glycosyltransferase [Mesobacillus maritimus]MCM3669233.1 glycosyltransferase family 4 protein [Mesobacillus maritimus]